MERTGRDSAQHGLEHMGGEAGHGEKGRPPLALGGSPGEPVARDNPRVDRRQVTTVTAIRAGEPISLPVRELDGACTGYRSRPAPFDGLLIEEGETSIFVGIDIVNVCVRSLRKRR